MRAPVEIAERVVEELSRRLDASAFERMWHHVTALGYALGSDPTRGQRLPRERVPARFSNEPNLWRAELPGGWRALYKVTTNRSGERTVRIVWVGDHRAYDRLFGYG